MRAGGAAYDAGETNGRSIHPTALRIADSYGRSLCPYYRFAGTAFTKAADCTSYAVGGGRINNFMAPTSPVSILQQVSDASANGFNANDLVLIYGGGNDAADLVGAYLKIASDGGASYRALLLTQLDVATVAAGLATGAQGAATLGGAYLKAPATRFAATIQASVIDKGATRGAVLNMPTVVRTPKLQHVLAGVAASAGAGADASVQAAALFTTWVQAFNTELSARFAGIAQVAVVDFYTSLDGQVANPRSSALPTRPHRPARSPASTACPPTTSPSAQPLRCRPRHRLPAPPAAPTGGRPTASPTASTPRPTATNCWGSSCRARSRRRAGSSTTASWPEFCPVTARGRPRCQTWAPAERACTATRAMGWRQRATAFDDCHPSKYYVE